MIRTPFSRFDAACWPYLRMKPGATLPLCEFKEWESKRSKLLLAKGATCIRGEPGPAFDYYDDKGWNLYFDAVLKNSHAKWDTLRLVIHGRRVRLAGFWQCNLCARYFVDRDAMMRHLASCVNPVKRRGNKKYVFPITAKGREWCPVCRMSATANSNLGYHIFRRHEDDVEELWAWGFDYDLIREQFGVGK
jgi:hypothetical protein